MKRITLVAGAALIFSMNAFAMKIGVVDMQKILSSDHGLGQIQGRLEKQFSDRRNQLMEMVKQIQADTQDLSKNKAILSKADAAKKEESLKSEKSKFQLAQAKYQQDVMEAQQKEMKGFVDGIKTAAKKVAEKNSLDAVFVDNSLLYGKDSQDVTQSVLDEVK
jgi:outer membrane protein